jgi:hypothetical protein
MVTKVIFLFLSFSLWVQEASLRLRTPAIVKVEAAGLPGSNAAAWVDQCPRCFTIWVKADFLQRATDDAQRIIAYHEVCHLFLSKGEPLEPDDFRYQVVHLAVHGCVQALLGKDTPEVLGQLPCQYYYPEEALEYQRLTGKVRCEPR